MKQLIVIAGPTASGKTDLAIELARSLNTEIISADSRQCYREMSIGVAKPSPEQLSAIPHHFINSHSIRDTVSAGIYERYALAKLEALFQLHEQVVVTGGTGLYLKALLHGIDVMPETNPALLQELEDHYKQHGLAWLQQQAIDTDPTLKNHPEISNPARILRALGFFLSTGYSITEFRKGQKQERNFDVVAVAIDIEREALYRRINFRVDEMMGSGLLDEVSQLTVFKSLKSLQTVGYQELFAYLEGKISLDESVDQIKQHTRNYAKRQITWFKHQDDFHWLQPEDALTHILSSIR